MGAVENNEDIDGGRAVARFGEHRAVLVLLGFTALVVALDISWLAADRRGFPLDIDEAGYMTIALSDHAALAHAGLGSFWHAIESQAPNAPLVPALTALVYVVRTSILASFAVELGFLVVLALATYGAGARLLGRRVGVVLAVAILSVPGVINFTREYAFALPATALLMCAVCALVYSHRLRSVPWAVGLGLALGLMLLARTMTVALVPAVILAGVVQVLSVPQARGRAAANLGLAVLVAVGIAAIWYGPNLSPVYHYLTDFGYGTHSAEYGAAHSVLSVAWWKRELALMFAEDLFLPLGLLSLCGFVIAAVTTGHRIATAESRTGRLAQMASSEAVTVAIVFLGGYVALSSSRNGGSGYALLLVPPFLILAALPLRECGRGLPVAGAAVGALAVVNLTASSDAWSSVSRPRLANVPVLGSVPVIDGEGDVLAALRTQLPGSPTRFAARERAWPRASSRAASFVIAFAHRQGRQPVVAFGMRNRVFNTNTVALAGVLYDGADIPMAQLDPLALGGDAAAYAHYLADPRHGQPNFLLTTTISAGDFTPSVNQGQAVAAARLDGFRAVRRMTLPDGRRVTFWWLPRGPVYDAAPGR